VDGSPVLRVVHRYPHPPAKVWRAITDENELRQWFPASMTFEPALGAAIEFRFPGTDTVQTGQVLEFDEPRVFAFTWAIDAIRIELVPDGTGTRLVFSQVMGGGYPWTKGIAGPRNAVGWRYCLRILDAHIVGEQPPQRPDMMAEMATLADELLVTQGESADGTVRFDRDLVWADAAEVWPLITDEQVTDNVFESTVDGHRARWEIAADGDAGTRLTLTVQAAAPEADELDAWRQRVSAVFGAIHGVSPRN
jgi:uncharacterized protein YndB with AHSA1/START domain